MRAVRIGSIVAPSADLLLEDKDGRDPFGFSFHALSAQLLKSRCQLRPDLGLAFRVPDHEPAGH